jgi:hypothetical protein
MINLRITGFIICDDANEFLPKVRESETNLNWNVKLTVRVKACLPEEPEPEPGG